MRQPRNPISPWKLRALASSQVLLLVTAAALGLMQMEAVHPEPLHRSWAQVGFYAVLLALIGSAFLVAHLHRKPQ